MENRPVSRSPELARCIESASKRLESDWRAGEARSLEFYVDDLEDPDRTIVLDELRVLVAN